MSEKITYTAEDIRLYLEGKMSPAQMHALEKAALSDPFLADALEGMEMHGNTEKFNAQVEDLRAKLAARAKTSRVVTAPVKNLWWKIAAVLMIMITGVAVIIFTGEKNKTARNELAKTEDKPNIDTTKKVDKVHGKEPEEVSKTENKVDRKPESYTNAESRKNQPVTNLKKSVAAEVDSEQKPAAAKNEEEIAATSMPSADIASETDSATPQEKISQPSPRNQAKAAQQIEGRAAGIDASRAETNDTVFDEVIVVGYGNTRKKNNRSKTLAAGRAERRVIPGNGWDEFERYIEDSTQINTADSVFTGEEHLSFTIGDDGLPESIKILRSVSPSHDQEAIRLLQNGPAWKITNGKSREIRLKIIF